jgi:nuclear pore complex protein Nup85
MLSSSQLSLRDHYIIAYANYLHSDPGFWRITVDYLYSCGNIGVSMADEILLHVPLRLQNKAMVTGTVPQSDELEGILGEVNKTCFDYQREAVRREVCKASNFIFVFGSIHL